MFYYFYHFLLSSCVCQLLIKFMMSCDSCLVWRKNGKIIRTLFCAVFYTIFVHNHKHTHDLSSFYRWKIRTVGYEFTFCVCACFSARKSLYQSNFCVFGMYLFAVGLWLQLSVWVQSIALKESCSKWPLWVESDAKLYTFTRFLQANK